MSEAMLPCFVAFLQVESTSMGYLAPDQTAENMDYCSTHTRVLNESLYDEGRGKLLIL